MNPQKGYFAPTALSLLALANHSQIKKRGDPEKSHL